ncbi:MAG: hypothetical protein KME10_22025 [Plectolyngbya sp. WJT66-NPBG17]|jgi:hypothetical protein|nr:hypothetical protein [Plectolyngbya sp. WJT66-NPBG17]
MRLNSFRIPAAIVGLVPTTIVGFALIANTQIEPAKAAAIELYEVAGGRFGPKPPPPRPLSQRELDEIIRQSLTGPCRPNPLDVVQFGEKKAYQIACSTRVRVKIKPRVRIKTRISFFDGKPHDHTALVVGVG